MTTVESQDTPEWKLPGSTTVRTTVAPFEGSPIGGQNFYINVPSMERGASEFRVYITAPEGEMRALRRMRGIFHTHCINARFLNQFDREIQHFNGNPTLARTFDNCTAVLMARVHMDPQIIGRFKAATGQILGHEGRREIEPYIDTVVGIIPVV